jgi:hypothetical protein
VESPAAAICGPPVEAARPSPAASESTRLDRDARNSWFP